MADALLLEDGSRILFEDDSGVLLLEAFFVIIDIPLTGVIGPPVSLNGLKLAPTTLFGSKQLGDELTGFKAKPIATNGSKVTATMLQGIKVRISITGVKTKSIQLVGEAPPYQ